jgi:hypothetical protein
MDAGHVGDAVHELLGCYIKGQPMDLEAVCDRYGVEDTGDVAYLVEVGKAIWHNSKEHFPNPMVEFRMEGTVSHGTADVASADFETLKIIDWKSGRVRRKHRGQLMSYGSAARKQFGMPACGKIELTEVWLRDQDVVNYEVTDEELDAHEQRIRDQLKLVGKQYAPGEACTFCPRRNDCGARTEYLQATTQALTPLAGKQYTLIDRKQIGLMYERVKQLKSAMDNYDKMLANALEEGPLPIGDGKEVRLVEQRIDKLDAMGTFLALMESDLGVTRDDMADVLKISKTKLLKAIGDKAPRGGKEALKRRTMGILKDAGVVSKTSRFMKKIFNMGDSQ